MAIAVDNTSNGTDGNSSELTVPHTVTSIEGGGILVVTVQVTDAAEDDRQIYTVTHNGEACTLMPGAVADDTVEARTEIWYRVNPTTGGTPNIVVTPVDTCTDLTLGAVSLTGVNTDAVSALVDDYDLSNYSTGQAFSPTITAIGQSFTATVSGSNNKLGYATFYTGTSAGSPTGDVVAKLYSHSGTYGTSSVPNALLATSDIIDASAMPDNTSVIFTFSGSEQYTLSDGVYYCILVEAADQTPTDYMRLGLDGASPTHSGNFFYGSSPNSTRDVIFLVHTTGTVQSATGASTPPTLSITTEGASSYVIDSLSSRESGGTAKMGAVHTDGDSPIHETDVGSDFHAAQFVDAGGAGPQTMNYTDIDQDTGWVLSAVSVQEAADDARVPRAGVVNFQIPGIV